MLDWLRTLDGLEQSLIEHACETYLRDKPDWRPGPGHIRKLAEARRKVEMDALRPRDARRHVAIGALPRPPAPDQVAQEEAERIVQAAGYTAEMRHALKRRPMARSRDEAMAVMEPPARWHDLAAPDSPEMKALARSRAQNVLIQAARKTAGMPPLEVLE